MNELIAKLEKQALDLNARQETALSAANAEGVSDEDRTKHLAEFDRLQAEKVKVKESLTRAQMAHKDRAELQNGRDQLAVNPIVQQPFNPLSATAGRSIIPAEQRRHGSLQAFRGPNAERDAYLTGLFVAGVFYGHQPSRTRLEEFGIRPQSTTLSTTNNAGAAYLVPNVMDTAIIELTEEYGVIRRLAEVVPMSSDTLSTPRWTGILTAYWVAQGTAPAQSDPAWDKVELVAKDLAAYGKMTVQINEDALIDLGDKWAMAAAIAFAYAEDNAAFNGDGTSAYGGITGLFTKIIAAANSASLVTATGHTTLAALTNADFASVVGKLPRYAGIKPRWFCHQEVFYGSMGPLQLAGGGNSVIDVAGGPTPSFMGYPVEFVNVAPKAATVTTGVTGILFGDLRMSTKLGDRRQRSMEVGRINDDMIKQLLTLFTAERVDIVNHTIVDPKLSTNPGPVIGLKLG